MSETKASQTKPEKIPKPYGAWRNPNVSWTDTFISFIISYLMDMKLVKMDPKSKEAHEELVKVRKQMQGNEDGFMGKAAVKKWSDASGGDRLAEYSGEIPFKKDILKEWKIIDSSVNDDILPDTVSGREKVKVLVRFPSRLLSPEQRHNAKILDYSGCLEVKELDLKTFAPNVPMMVQFHGGALFMGGAHKTQLLNDTAALVSTFAEENGTAPPDVITISVEYGLAPEEPFPVAIMDSLSVVEYLLGGNNDRKTLHISGESAGGYVSTVVGMEAYRKFPGRILSIEAQCPMINPSSDSMSYYMNQNIFPGSLMVRWGWRAYLGLDAPKHEDATPTTVEEALREDSNYTTWAEWKGKHSMSLQRLVDPTLGLPDGLDKKDAPKIIIRLNKGDPLHDEGIDLVELLEKANANLGYFDDKGLHCSVGGVYDPDGYKEIMKTWSSVLFGSSK